LVKEQTVQQLLLLDKVDLVVLAAIMVVQQVYQQVLVDYMVAAVVAVTVATELVVRVVAVQLEYFGVQAVLSQLLMLTAKPVNIIVHSKHINI